MAKLKIQSITDNPIRILFTLNNQGHSLEYPNKEIIFEKMRENLQHFETQAEIALLLILQEWIKTDPTLDNIEGLTNKTCKIIPVKVSINE